ncbi:jg15541 [Pararge aegeria aegeria]|uniref:Jg15541 protein n=1 Tax=Pararge aegeria aegeria TaxID=348720 RepID=A0A8S4RWJ9_9NEOP|nr:jg15541 [Pararge aegeria aegeria]
MGDSSDSEEFFDAEEFTPVKGSKRSSICKSTSITESNCKEKDKEKTASKPSDAPIQPNVGATSTPVTENAVAAALDDRNMVKNVVQGRRRFQELRRCMQTEEEDEPDPPLSVPTEHPFKIISHDTMSLQSMTSLGRIGRILSGAAESHSNIRESTKAPSASSREPSTMSDEPINADRTQNVLAMAEPDVIASTKANSLKQNRASSAAIVSMSGSAPTEPRPASVAGPVAPPRKKKRSTLVAWSYKQNQIQIQIFLYSNNNIDGERLHGSQSLSAADGDNLSICTTDTDEIRYVRRPEKPQLETLLVEVTVLNLDTGEPPRRAADLDIMNGSNWNHPKFF